jgi:hypothetical protein
MLLHNITLPFTLLVCSTRSEARGSSTAAAAAVPVTAAMAQRKGVCLKLLIIPQHFMQAMLTDIKANGSSNSSSSNATSDGGSGSSGMSRSCRVMSNNRQQPMQMSSKAAGNTRVI